MSERKSEKKKIPVAKAIEIVGRAIKAVAGKGQPNKVRSDQTLESLGISTSENLLALKHQLKAEVASEGYEFKKMGIEELLRTHTVKEAATLVTHAQPIDGPTLY